MAKKKTKNANPKQIVRDLRDNRKQQKTQREAMVEQITIADAKIDQFDEMINTLDDKLPPLIGEINDSIDAVKKAYDDRIDADCLSPLIWELQETKEVNSKAYALERWQYNIPNLESCKRSRSKTTNKLLRSQIL